LVLLWHILRPPHFRELITFLFFLSIKDLRTYLGFFILRTFWTVILSFKSVPSLFSILVKGHVECTFNFNFIIFEIISVIELAFVNLIINMISLVFICWNIFRDLLLWFLRLNKWIWSFIIFLRLVFLRLVLAVAFTDDSRLL
jgi:hypothetical protein